MTAADGWPKPRERKSPRFVSDPGSLKRLRNGEKAMMEAALARARIIRVRLQRLDCAGNSLCARVVSHRRALGAAARTRPAR